MCALATNAPVCLSPPARPPATRAQPTSDSDELPSDHEEEFYYTECDVALQSVVESLSDDTGLYASSPPTLSHMDMARPPHEDPQYQRELAMRAAAGGGGKQSKPKRSNASNISQVGPSDSQAVNQGKEASFHLERSYVVVKLSTPYVMFGILSA